jgi:uncharacterized protein with HEPN domain
VPPRDWRLRLEDIVKAAGSIEVYVRDMTFEAFCADQKTVDAVVRNLEVIGEAARHVPDEVRRRFPEVAWADMSDMRNVLVHEYFGVDLPILWKTICSDLPPVVPILKAILATDG